VSVEHIDPIHSVCKYILRIRSNSAHSSQYLLQQHNRKEAAVSLCISSAKSHEQRIGQSSGARSPLIKVNIRLGTNRLTAFVIYPPQGVGWPVFVYVLFKASR
jgi:hypothetical protein